jgi:hypothetical protein
MKTRRWANIRSSRGDGGSSSKISAGPMNHPAMAVSLRSWARWSSRSTAISSMRAFCLRMARCEITSESKSASPTPSRLYLSRCGSCFIPLSWSPLRHSWFGARGRHTRFRSEQVQRERVECVGLVRGSRRDQDGSGAAPRRLPERTNNPAQPDTSCSALLGSGTIM